MSWQSYVDSSLVGSGHIDKAVIFSAAGDSTWANSPGFTLTPEEMKTIVTILQGDQGAKDKSFSDGFYVAGERCVATRIEDGLMYGRKGKEGVCIVKTKQAVLVGHHDENMQAGNATQTVAALGDYLTGLGY